LILGLDISTSCTGWCLLNTEGTFVAAGYIPLSSHKCMFRKAEESERAIEKLVSQNKITRIGIEQNLQSFRSGFSSAHTLSSLSRFNGIVSYIVFKKTGIFPEFINVNSARKHAGIKVIRKSKGGAPVKEQVFDWAKKEIENSKYLWPEKTLKSGPRKGQTIMHPGCYDIADALVIAIASHSMNS
jgi:Holliday junction resolvasome RuvABC endonuclease subunit